MLYTWRQEAHPRAWGRDMQHDILALQVLHDFIFRYARLPPWLRGSSTVPTLLIHRIAGCNAPWGLPGAHNTIIHLSLHACFFCVCHLLLGGKSATRLEYFLSYSHACLSLLDKDLESPLSPAGNTAAPKIEYNLFQPSLLLTLLSVSLSLEMLSLCFNPHLSLGRLVILYFP